MTAAVFDLERPWALDERVALRPESFGALAYHFGTRRLSFLKHPALVRVVEGLAGQPTAHAAVAAAGVSGPGETAIASALAVLAESGMIVERTA